jgi:hypothetical protein
VRLAAFSCEAGLVEIEQLVGWVEQQLASAGGASEELREAALVLAGASCQVSVCSGVHAAQWLHLLSAVNSITVLARANRKVRLCLQFLLRPVM